MGLTDDEKKDLSERRLDEPPNQGPHAVPTLPQRNQPSPNGYYYAPDEGARKPIDAWVEDDLKTHERFVHCVVTNYPPHGSPHHVTVLRVALTDSWYVQDSGSGDGRNFDKSLFKGTDVFEAYLLFRKLVLTTPPFPKG